MSKVNEKTQSQWVCVLCGNDSRELFQVDGIGVRECHHCGHQFAGVEADESHIKKVYGDDYFNGGGAGYHDYFAEERLLRSRGKWYAKLLSRFTKPGTALKIGCAAGFGTAALVEAGWDVEGIEPNEAMARYGREKLGLRIQCGSLEAIPIDRQFDLVTMLQVLAHFANPREAMEKASNAVKPGGLLVIETWDRGSLSAKFFGKRWHEYAPPSVLHWFTKAELDDLARSFGMKRIGVGRPSKWIDAGHARSLLTHKVGRNPVWRTALAASRIIPDRFPIPYPSEDLFWAIYRKE